MFNEEQLEDATLSILESLGYERLNGYEIDRDYHNIFMDNLFEDLKKINEDFDDEQILDAIKTIKTLSNGNLIQDNKIFTRYLLEGVPILVKINNDYQYKNVKLIDFNNIYNNHFQAIQQYTIIEFDTKRPDIIIFINGIPLVVIELKTTTNEDVKLIDAYNQLNGYKNVSIPSLFKYNQFLIISDGVTAKAGTITSPYSRFSDWKKVEDTDSVYENMPTHETLFNGMFRKDRLLDIIENFILFSDDKKILSQYHQYFGVKKAIISTVEKGIKTGKAGILWHTQGSGKSFSMVFYTGNMIKLLYNPTIVVVTDRNDLDNQLYETFLKCEYYLKQKPQKAESRKILDEMLKDRKSGGIFFTTLQKFEEETGLFTDRNDILVLVDEAHRSHYGLEATMKIDYQTNEVKEKYGTAKYLHDSLPNATYIGFTGTPVETKDKSTSAIFGEVIDTYDMTQAILDGSTVPIMYESRMARVGLNQKILDKIDDYYKSIEDLTDESTINKSKQMMANISQVIEDPDRLELIVKDIINHYEDRKDMVADHAMVVAYSRKSAHIMYQIFLKLRPDYKDVVNMIITPSNKDSEEMQKDIGTKSDKKELEKRFKNEKDDPNERFKIAIVVDMWLTGFDVPRLGVMYIDKPMKSHNLMQAIARVNRVYKNKQAGLIVDYIGLKSWLLDALKTYTTRDQKQIVDNEELINTLKDKIEIIDGILNEFDYSNFNNLDNTGKYNLIKDGANLVLSYEDKKKRFMKHSLDLKNLYTLCSGIVEKYYKDKVLFIISVRSFISKISNDNKLDVSEINRKVSKMLEEAIKEDELINLGDLSRGNSLELLSDTMINKLKSLNNKNIVAEILEKALKTTINNIGKTNLTIQEKFSTKFIKIVDAYNERTEIVDIEKIIEEMINLKNEIEEELNKGNLYNLSQEEKAFFDALGKDPEIKKLMEDDVLVQIAKDLVEIINENLTLDAFKRADARARIRVNIRILLIKYNYPPVKREGAVEQVIKQAELKFYDK